MHTAKFHLLICALLCISCSEHDSDPNVCDAFSASASIQDSMHQPAAVFNTGENITFQVKIRNLTNATVTLSTVWSCEQTAFEVNNQSNQLVWKSEEAFDCFVSAQPRVYAPFEEVVHERRWSQNDSNGVQVVAGRYKMNGVLGARITDSSGKVTECGRARSEAAEFRVL